ncbi:MAG TPA: DUF6677 family protein [Gemmataceae bacterium]|nr:DUF6677 family protein [Gemmataceae bacterium]
MANAADTTPPPPPAQPTYAPVAALLSYLVPGLGQIHQGRVAKGILFLVCLYGLFFYGMALGNWQNVYIPDSPPSRDGREQPRLIDTLTDRARFAGQFWIGVAAWPALAQHFSQPSAADIAAKLQEVAPGRPPSQDEVNRDLRAALDQWRKGVPPHPLFGTYMRAPDEEVINRQLQGSDKKPDLGWMYTVIAGVLNILVIYDAFAGPAFAASQAKPPPEPEPTEEKPVA